jgi:tetratricopeptide (TPR) repeat protein
MERKMLKSKFVIIAEITLAVTICCCGCNSRAEKKQAMVEKWANDTAKSNVHVARGLLESGEIDQAIETLQQCIAGSDDLVEAHLLLGKAYFMQNRLVKANTSFAKVLELDDQLAQGWYWLGETAARQSRYKAAIDCYDYAIQIDPSVSAYVIAAAGAHAAMDDYDTAIALIVEKKKAFVGDTSMVIVHADMLTRSGKKDQAVKVYQNGLLFNSDAPELQEGLGYLYMVEKRWEDAARMFEKLLAAAQDRKNNEYLSILSTCSMNTGQYSRSLGYLDRFGPEKKQDAGFWLKTGQAALGAGKAKRAVACAQKALFLNAGWDDASMLLGCGQYMDGDYRDAIETFSGVVYNKKVSSFAWMMTAKCYQQIGDDKKAKKAFEKAAASNANERIREFVADAAEK